MTRFGSARFLASDARFGHWWLPRGEDLNEQGELDGLPIRREVGVLASSEAGHWELVISSTRRPGDETIDEPWSDRLVRRDAIWGSTDELCVSLFDGFCVRPRSPLTSDSESTWTGNWSAESECGWFNLEDRVRHVEIEFDLGAAWAASTRGGGPDINLRDHWDAETLTFEIPDVVVHEAEVDSARVQLRCECTPRIASSSFSAQLRTYFSIEDDLPLRDVGDRWVRPLYELVSFLAGKNARVTLVRARDSRESSWASLIYPEPLASGKSSVTSGSSPVRVRFATLGDLVARGMDFQSLLGTHFALDSEGFGAALAPLVDTQGALLDRSVGARFLSAIRSLETFERTFGVKKSKFTLKRTVKNLIEESGVIGDDMKRLWRMQTERGIARSIVEYRDRFSAHGQPGDRGRFPTESENRCLAILLTALRWLLRWRYLQALGISAEDAESLVRESTDYRMMIRGLEEQEASVGAKY